MSKQAKDGSIKRDAQTGKFVDSNGGLSFGQAIDKLLTTKPKKKKKSTKKG